MVYFYFPKRHDDILLFLSHKRLKPIFRSKSLCASAATLPHLAVEVSRLTEEAVLFVRPVGAAVLVVAAVRSRVAGSVSGTGELVLLTGRTVQLVPTVRTVPVAIAPLLLRVTPPVSSAGNLPGQTEPVHLKSINTKPGQTKYTNVDVLEHESNSPDRWRWILWQRWSCQHRSELWADQMKKPQRPELWSQKQSAPWGGAEGSPQDHRKL